MKPHSIRLAPRTRISGRKCWEIRDRQQIRLLSENPALTTRFGRSSSPDSGESNPLLLTTSEGSVHDELRCVFSNAIRAVIKKPFQSTVNETFRRLVRDFSGVRIDLLATNLDSISAFVVGEILQVPIQDRRALAMLHRKQARAAERGRATGVANEFATYLWELRGLTLKNSRKESVWSALATAPSLTDRVHDQLLNASLVYEAGIDALDTMVYSAVIASDHIRRLAKDLSEIHAAEWLVAHSSPVERLSKVAVSKVSVGDILIEPGEAVLFCYADANADWQMASGHHIAFGAGAHKCVAAGLATMLARIVISSMMDGGVSFRLITPPTYSTNPSLRVFESVEGILGPLGPEPQTERF